MNKILFSFSIIFHLNGIKLEVLDLLFTENKSCNASIEFKRLDIDCSKYYRCIENRLEIISCPTGHFFDQSIKLCKLARSVDCSYSKNPKPKTIVSNLNACDMNLVNKPASNDCSSYYKCVKNELKLLQCPKNFKFDVKSKFCVFESLVNCSHNLMKENQITNDVLPEMKECEMLHQKIVPDSFCTKFYLCAGQKLKILSCPIPFLYDTEKKKCNYANQVFCLERILDSKRFDSSNNKRLVSSTSNNRCNLKLHRTPVPNTFCSEFFFCFKNKLVKLNCPSNLIFDSNRKMCFYKNQVNCNTESNSTISESNYSYIEKIHNKKIECSYKMTVPGKCNKFYCVSNKIVKIIDCPKNFFFDAKINECNYEKEVKCVNSSINFYSKNYHSLIDYDSNLQGIVCDMNLHKKLVPETFCTQFFYCINNKLKKLICPVNLLFDENKQMCNYADRVSCQESISFINNYNHTTVIQNDSTISENSELVVKNVTTKISGLSTEFKNKIGKFTTDDILQEFSSLSTNIEKQDYSEFYSTLNIDSHLTTLLRNSTDIYYYTTEIKNNTNLNFTESLPDTSEFENNDNSTSWLIQNTFSILSSTNSIKTNSNFNREISSNSDKFSNTTNVKNQTEINVTRISNLTNREKTESTQFYTSSYPIPISLDYKYYKKNTSTITSILTKNSTNHSTQNKFPTEQNLTASSVSYYTSSNSVNILKTDLSTYFYKTSTASINDDEVINGFFVDLVIEKSDYFLNKSQQNSTYSTAPTIIAEKYSTKIETVSSEESKENDIDDSFELETFNISESKLYHLLNLTKLANSISFKINKTEFELSIDLDSNDTITDDKKIYEENEKDLSKNSNERTNSFKSTTNIILLLDNNNFKKNLSKIESNSKNVSNISIINNTELEKYINATPPPLTNFKNITELISNLMRFFNYNSNPNHTKPRPKALNTTLREQTEINSTNFNKQNSSNQILLTESSSVQDLLNNGFIDWCEIVKIGLVPACLNGATCQNVEYPIDYICICKSNEYSGRFCEIKL